MSRQDIDSVVQSFARAARSARLLGFDGIELHGGHGYLIDQFLWSRTNQRTDDYGGSPLARARFAADVVRACRAEVGPNLPIFFRLSQWKVSDFDAKIAHSPAELEALLGPLHDAGVDAFHCSTRRFWEPEFDGSALNLAGWVKKLTGAPTITVGSVGLDGEFLDTLLSGAGADVTGLDQITLLVQRGQADLVAVGRSLLQDPYWTQKVREGRFEQLAAFDANALKQLS